MIRPVRVVSTILALLLFTLETIHPSEITITRVEETTGRVAKDLFAWNVDLDVEDMIRVEAIELDETTFAPDDLLTVVLDLGGSERSVALILDPAEEWEDAYSQRLETLLRANALLLVSEPPETMLTDVLHSGYWMRESPHAYGPGTEFLVASDTPLARLVVLDSFEFEGDVVTEFLPLWSSRDLVAGMPLEEKRTIRTKLSLPFSLQRFGLSLEADFAIPRTMFRIAILGEFQKEYSQDAYEVTGAIGVRRTLSLGMFAPPESLGQWWTNMFIVPNMQLHMGIRSSNGSVAFLQGAEAGLGIGYQIGAHVDFGVQVSYRYRATMASGVSTSVQSNENGIVLSPSIGWIW